MASLIKSHLQAETQTMGMETTNYETAATLDLLVGLDRAIAALTVLDADRLESLLLHLSEAAEFDSFGGSLGVDLRNVSRQIPELQARQRVLGTLVENTGGNLAVLERLQGRKVARGDVWVR